MSRLKWNLIYKEYKAERLRKARVETYEWYLDAYKYYEEGIEEKEVVEEENVELRNRLL